MVLGFKKYLSYCYLEKLLGIYYYKDTQYTG